MGLYCRLIAAARACAVAGIAAGCVGGTAWAADAPPGNAGIRTAAQDRADMATLCLGGNGPDNLVLVIMVRGSGEAPRKGQLATRYFPALASALAARGYQVTGADLDYPAMPIGALTDGRIGQYISSAYDNGPSIARQIQTLIGHCPGRKVVAAAYSQGGIALRRAITTQLRSYPNVWGQIVNMDLVGDASAHHLLDNGMPVGKTPRVKAYARRNTRGIWEIAAPLSRDLNTPDAQLLIRGLSVNTTIKNIGRVPVLGGLEPYPRPLMKRTDRYCALDDPVCSTGTLLSEFLSRATSFGCTSENPVRFAACLKGKSVHNAFRSLAMLALSQHTGSYQWRFIALDTADLFSQRTPAPPLTPPAPPSVPPSPGTSPLAGITQISAGADHTCALIADGTVRCWGGNAGGQLGDGSTVNSSRPVQVQGLTQATQVLAGQGFSCARRTDATVWCWGGLTLTATLVPGLTGVNSISTDADLGFCVVLGSGTVSCGGLAPFAQPFVNVSGLGDATQVASGLGGSCARRANGGAICWVDPTSPVAVALSGVSQVLRDAIMGGCGVTATDVECWGLNPAGSSTPIPGFATATQLSGRWSHRCARLADSTVRCEGSNASGELGDGSTNSSTSGVAVAGLAGVTQVAAGGGYQAVGLPHTCARLADGTARCWGGNNFGQLGDGTTTSRTMPVTVGP